MSFRIDQGFGLSFRGIPVFIQDRDAPRAGIFDGDAGLDFLHVKRIAPELGDAFKSIIRGFGLEAMGLVACRGLHEDFSAGAQG